jgi:hypothetical protein
LVKNLSEKFYTIYNIIRSLLHLPEADENGNCNCLRILEETLQLTIVCWWGGGGENAGEGRGKVIGGVVGFVVKLGQGVEGLLLLLEVVTPHPCTARK